MVDLAFTVAALHEMPPLTWTFVDGIPIMRDSCDGESLPAGLKTNESATWADYALHHSRLDAWSIADDGMVTPSVHFLNCGWHEHVRLLDWIPDPSDDKAGPE